MLASVRAVSRFGDARCGDARHGPARRGLAGWDARFRLPQSSRRVAAGLGGAGSGIGTAGQRRDADSGFTELRLQGGLRQGPRDCSWRGVVRSAEAWLGPGRARPGEAGYGLRVRRGTAWHGVTRRGSAWSRGMVSRSGGKVSQGGPRLGWARRGEAHQHSRLRRTAGASVMGPGQRSPAAAWQQAWPAISPLHGRIGSGVARLGRLRSGMARPGRDQASAARHGMDRHGLASSG
jgi:hypothetical protein